MRAQRVAGVQYIGSLGVLTLVSVGMMGAESLQAGELMQGYLAWNLVLAWVPFGLALWLVHMLRHKLWSSWEALLLSAAWVMFLPNSFYMISDFIHLPEVDPNHLLYSAVTFSAFILSGLLLGLSSVYLLHREFLKRASARVSAGLVALLLLLSSGAIYIGRDLRWNSWDVLLSPFGLIFDISERLTHPSEYPQALAIILPFFVLLAGLYTALWKASQAIQPIRKK